MIKLTSYKDIQNYYDVPDAAIEFIEGVTKDTENGFYPFSDDCFIRVMDAPIGKASGAMEAHDVYTDAQCLITGEERIYYTDRTPLKVTKPYNEDADVTFFEYENSPYVDYKGGEIIILEPSEAHMPGCAINGDIVAKKAVIKINYEKLKK